MTSSRALRRPTRRAALTCAAVVACAAVLGEAANPRHAMAQQGGASAPTGGWHHFGSGDGRDASSAAAQKDGRPAPLRVQTNLVNILASVMDDHGRPVAGLTQDAFSLSEEGVPQKITRFEPETNRPLDLALMVDSSASTFRDLKDETEAAAHFIQQVVRPGDTLGVFEFAEHVTEIGEFSNDVTRLQADIRRIELGSGTSLYDAVVLGSNALRRRPEGRRRAIVIVTDAGETTSASKFEDARRAAIGSGALLYTLVIRPVKNENGRNTAGEHALITIIDSTGGALFTVEETSQLESIFDEIDKELRTQYLLGYYPDPIPPADSDRHVQVKLAGPYTVNYRKEYFTAP